MKAKFKNSIKIAEEAKELRNQAQKILNQARIIEEEAVESFRKERKELIGCLNQRKEDLNKQLEKFEKEIQDLGKTFCKQKGAHTTVNKTRELIQHGEIAHTFHGAKYPTVTYWTCLICGEGYRRGPCCNKGSEDVIKKASEQNENLELKKTALRILEVLESINKIHEELQKNREDFKEVCSLFGHETEYGGHPQYWQQCKCCGEHIDYDSYDNAYHKAVFRGQILNPGYGFTILD